MLLMLKEAERAISKVDDRCDNNERHYPVAEVIKYSKSRADEQLDEVIPRPSYDIGNGEACSTGKACTGVCDEFTHIDLTLVLLVNGDRSLPSCRTCVFTHFPNAPLYKYYGKVKE